MLFLIRILFVSIMFFLFVTFFFSSPIRLHAVNISTAEVPRIEYLYPLPTNDQLKIIAAQFNQNPNWEEGNMPISLTREEETKPREPTEYQWPIGPGIVKTGHLFHTDNMHGYRIDPEGVHPNTEHHIFLTRHGLYFNTEDEANSHLLRYGKYQARMAGDKINRKIKELIQEFGPLTRPIKLVSSTQTRAFETLFNIRLQLNNNLKFETEIIQDTGLTECVDQNKQRMRWLYFVREYLQPIQSKRREHTITIIASHGNLLTTFDYIIQRFLVRQERLESFASLALPYGVGILHAQTLLYRTVGTKPIYFKETFLMDEIPITVNHAHLRKDFYYEWAAMHQCQSYHGHEDKTNYVRSATLDNVFSPDSFVNGIPDFETIIYLELLNEFETHILPMMMHTCRSYLYRLPFIQANTNFSAFNRLTSPVPIPETEEEQSSPLNVTLHQFSAYGMPFSVDNTIQKFRKNPMLSRQRVPRGSVHPDSRILLFLVRHDKYPRMIIFHLDFQIFSFLRLNVATGDDRVSYLTRLGINQIRGVMSHVHSAIHSYRKNAPKNLQIYPINVIAEPTVHAAESAFHIRDLLLNANYHVAGQVTDLGIQFNYFRRKSIDDFLQYQRVQILYLLRHYLTPDQNNGTHPTLRTYILCGDGRLFTAFRQEIALSNLLLQPYPRFSTFTDPGYNALKHGNGFFFEAIGDDVLKLHEILTLIDAKGIQDEQKVPTDNALFMPKHEMKSWFRNPTGPCTLSYFLENQDRLAVDVVNSASAYQKHIARLLRTEWNPYLAGLFIYACRYQWALLGACYSHESAAVQCKEQDAGHKGPAGDHA